MGQKVAILGATDRPDRFAYKAFRMLCEYGHTPLPVSFHLEKIEGVGAVKSLNDIKEPVDTLTMYVGPQISSSIKEEILNLKTKRVIFNPGTENPPLQSALEAKGVEVIVGCTLVMLSTGQFDQP